MATSHDPGASMLHENAGATLKVFQGGAISIDGIAGITVPADLSGILSGEKVNSIYDIPEEDFDRLFKAIRDTLEADAEFTAWRARSGVKHTIETYKGRRATERGASVGDRENGMQTRLSSVNFPSDDSIRAALNAVIKSPPVNSKHSAFISVMDQIANDNIDTTRICQFITNHPDYTGDDLSTCYSNYESNDRKYLNDILAQVNKFNAPTFLITSSEQTKFNAAKKNLINKIKNDISALPVEQKNSSLSPDKLLQIRLYKIVEENEQFTPEDITNILKYGIQKYSGFLKHKYEEILKFNRTLTNPNNMSDTRINISDVIRYIAKMEFDNIQKRIISIFAEMTNRNFIQNVGYIKIPDVLVILTKKITNSVINSWKESIIPSKTGSTAEPVKTGMSASAAVPESNHTTPPRAPAPAPPAPAGAPAPSPAGAPAPSPAGAPAPSPAGAPAAAAAAAPAPAATPVEEIPDIVFNEDRRIGIDANFGNQCFIDTALQLLADSPAFVKFLNGFQNPDDATFDSLTDEEKQAVKCIRAIKRVLYDLHLNNTDATDLSESDICTNKYIKLNRVTAHDITPKFIPIKEEDRVEQTEIYGIVNSISEKIYKLLTTQPDLFIEKQYPFNVSVTYYNDDDKITREISRYYFTVYSDNIRESVNNTEKTMNSVINNEYRIMSDDEKKQFNTMNELIIRNLNRTLDNHLSKKKITQTNTINIENNTFKLRGIAVYSGTGGYGHYRYVTVDVNGTPSLLFNGDHVCDNNIGRNNPDGRKEALWNSVNENVGHNGILYLYRRTEVTSVDATGDHLHEGGQIIRVIRKEGSGKRRTLKKGRQAPVKKARRRTLGAARR